MGTGPSPSEGRAYGQAKIKLNLDGPLGEVHLTCTAAWYDADGNLSEALLQVSGEAEELFPLLQECTTWVHRRWKRPVAREYEAVGPFD